MKSVKKITLAAAVMTLALGGGVLANNVASANDTVLTALTMSQDGMAIRANNPEGLRFEATLAMSDAQMQDAGIVGTGMILMPADKVDGALEYGETNGTTTALDIPTAVYNKNSTDTSKSYYSAIVNSEKQGAFPADFYNVPITARAYVKYENGSYKYSENTITRSIGYVATMSYLNGLQDSEGVIAKIANGTTKEIVVENDKLLAGSDGTQATLVVGGQTVANTYVAWSVEGDAATISQTGEITPVKAGTVSVKATVSVEEGTPVTFTKTITVDVTKKTENVESFVMQQSNDEGTVVTNDYEYELSNVNVNAVTLGGNALTADEDYTIEGNTITVKGDAFLGLERGNNRGKAQLLKVESNTEIVEVTFGKIITFAITKASDVNVGNSKKAAPFMIPGGATDGAIGPSHKYSWDGYYVLANDVDFEYADVQNNAPVVNATGDNNACFVGIFDGQGYAFKNFRVTGDNRSFFGTSQGTLKNTKFIDFRIIAGSYKANFGLFDRVGGVVDNVYVDGIAESGCLLGYWANYAVFSNSTVHARTGANKQITEENVVFHQNQGSIPKGAMSGTTIYTQYPVNKPKDELKVEKAITDKYFALKVDDTQTGGLKDNTFVKEIQGTSILSATLYYGTTSVDITNRASLANGNVTVDLTETNDFAGSGTQHTIQGRGRTIKIVTDKETQCYSQDIFSYAIDDLSDIHTSDYKNGVSRFFEALKSHTRSYVALTKDILCDTTTTVCTGGTCYNGGFGNVPNRGFFDGLGYTIDNIRLYNDNTKWRSFFGSTTGTTIQDVNFTNLSFNDGVSYGLFGHNSAPYLKRVFVEGTGQASNSAIGSINKWATMDDCTFVIRTNANTADASTANGVLVSYDGAAKNFGVVIYTDYAIPSNFTITAKYSIAEWDALNA